MASSIPRAYLKELTDALALENLYVALFTSAMDYTATDATNTYTIVAGKGGEVSNSGTGYTTMGYKLTLASAVASLTACKITATATTITTATFTARYAMIYNFDTKKIRAIVDFGDKVVTSGTFTITWSASGVIRVSFA
jgi:hypothetical protein